MAKAGNNPDFFEETAFWAQGKRFVFGIDEAGRGCLAGPVCAAVTAWQTQDANHIPVEGIRDSKLMTEPQREKCFEPILERAFAYGIGFASPLEIDRWNILQATSLAVARAMEYALAFMINNGHLEMGAILNKDFAFLADGSHPLLNRAQFFIYHMEYSPEFPLLQKFFEDKVQEKCVIKGDSKVFSIATASILAKVSRDRRMLELHQQYPAYNFARHKGYSTELHIENLKKAGPSPEHRFSFAPVNQALPVEN